MSTVGQRPLPEISVYPSVVPANSIHCLTNSLISSRYIILCHFLLCFPSLGTPFVILIDHWVCAICIAWSAKHHFITTTGRQNKWTFTHTHSPIFLMAPCSLTYTHTRQHITLMSLSHCGSGNLAKKWVSQSSNIVQWLRRSCYHHGSCNLYNVTRPLQKSQCMLLRCTFIYTSEDFRQNTIVLNMIPIHQSRVSMFLMLHSVHWCFAPRNKRLHGCGLCPVVGSKTH